MVLVRDGASVSRKDRSRPILSLRGGSDGSNVNALFGGEPHEYSEQGDQGQVSVASFENALGRAAAEWLAARKANGDGRRIGKREAAAKLRLALARLEGGA